MSDDTFNLHFELRRTPLRDLDREDAPAVRAHIREHAEARARMHGHHPALARFLYDTFEEVGPLDGLVDLGRENLVALLFRQAAARPGVLRRFREGEVLVRDESGALRRALCILEHLPGDEGDGWWVAHRFLGQGEAGVGVFHGDWIEREGVGLEELGPPFAEWLDVGRAEITRSEFGLREGEGPDFDIRMALIPRDTSGVTDAMEVLDMVARMTDGEVARKGLGFPIAFVVTDEAVERWELEGEPPCSFDDVLRNLTGMAQTKAVEVLSPGTIDVDGVTKRGTVAIAEMGGRRARRLVPVDFKPDGSIHVERVYLTDLGEVPEGEGWIGVEPGTELGLRALGPVEGAGGGVVPEG